MSNIQQKLNEISVSGYKLDFSDVINAAIENYKKIAMNTGIAFLLSQGGQICRLIAEASSLS